MGKKKKKFDQLPFRLNVLFLIIFLMFAVLIIRLGMIQILDGQMYQDEINRSSRDIIKMPVPRGKIYDRNYKVIADNKALYSITYTPPRNIQPGDRLKVAKNLSNYIAMYDDKSKSAKERIITERDKKDYWYLLHEEEAKKKLSEAERKNTSGTDQYNLILDRIEEEEWLPVTEKDLNVLLIKKEMDKATALTPQIIKNDHVTFQEFAKVSEHLHELPGVSAETDWERSYPYHDLFKSLVGSITTEKQGIPSENLDLYLAKGYSRNDRIGKSGLEAEYEDLLRGRKAQVKSITNKKGERIDTETIVDGERGKDVILTIDMDLQEKVDQIVKNELKAAKSHAPYLNRFLEDAMAVVIKPKTGEILAISGSHYNKRSNRFENADHSVLYDAREPGSAIKGATVLAGLQSGVITPGTVFYDAPIKIAGTPPKKSVYPMGPVNEIAALKKSSNVYMFQIAMRMGGEYHYQPDKNITFDPQGLEKMRNYFSQFGLGVKTGVDFPYEASGYKGIKPRAGNLLDLGIGQYDTYTTLQLAQYVSTIANDGYRVRPHFLKEVREPVSDGDQPGALMKAENAHLINKIDMETTYLNRVQEGFRQVFQEPGGTAFKYFSSAPFNTYKIAGKTGTAQNEVYENGRMTETENHSLVAYAPYDNPEIAIAVLVPKSGVGMGYPDNFRIAQGIFKAYYDLKKKES